MLERLKARASFSCYRIKSRMKTGARFAFELYFFALVVALNCSSSLGLASQQQQRQTRFSAAPFSSVSRSEENVDRATTTSRRNLLQKTIPAAIGFAAAGLFDGSVTVKLVANALETETIGKDPDCDDSTCLGVWDGLLADCPHGSSSRMPFGAGCTSSQDDTPGIFSEPWDFSEVPNIISLDSESQMERLVPAIQLVAGRRSDRVKILIRRGPYLRVLFEDGKSGEESVGEFYFTPNDTTVQFRVAGVRGGGLVSAASSIRNIERCELIRKEMRYLKVPVLRNRKRTLFFFESDLDAFGPGSANLGSPVERNTREFDEQTFPSFKMDLMQQFPTPPQ